MSVTTRARLWAGVALALAAAGCGNNEVSPAATPTATTVVADTPTPPVPSRTAVATASATGTPSPIPTATAAEVSYEIAVSAPRFVIPSEALPPETTALLSNNNVDIFLYDDRLFLAWRTAPNHFAGPDTHLYIISSADGGETWQLERDIFLGADMREPRFVAIGGYLQLMFFEAGTNPGAFEPMRLWRTRRLGPAQWSDLEVLTDAGEVPWDVKVHDGVAYRTSYMGEHYGAGDTSEIAVFFKQSTDGTTWTDVGGRDHVYFGGVSEVAFEFDLDGSLWAVTRNEDGDASGFGSHLCRAPAEDLSAWDCPSQTDPERYDSPKMFRHEGEIYLVARRDVGGPYDRRDTDLSLAQRRGRYLIDYSLRPKRTALYRIDRTARRVVHVMDLPGVGDTAFPSVRQTGPHSFLLANYTSPLDDPDISWLQGQTSDRGTQIYLATIDFVPYSGPTHTPTLTPTPTPTPTRAATEERPPLELSPVFAAPGVPLMLAWPEVASLVGIVDLGDGTRVGPETVEHAYAAVDAIYEVMGSLEIGGQRRELAGAVARTDVRAVTPLNGLTLTQPDDDVVVQVIRGLMPAFYYALDADRFAVASDPTGSGAFSFTDVAVAGLSADDTGAFTTGPVDMAVELTGAGGQPSGMKVRLVGATWSGVLNGKAIGSPLQMDGEIVIADIVTVAQNLAGLEPDAALGFIAGLFGFDATAPPERVPFRAELQVAAAPL